MGVEVVGTTGRLIMDDVGDGKNPAGEWTGTYKNTGVIWRGDEQVSAQDCRILFHYAPPFQGPFRTCLLLHGCTGQAGRAAF